MCCPVCAIWRAPVHFPLLSAIPARNCPALQKLLSLGAIVCMHTKDVLSQKDLCPATELYNKERTLLVLLAVKQRQFILYLIILHSLTHTNLFGLISFFGISHVNLLMNQIFTVYPLLYEGFVATIFIYFVENAFN
jgi:hypothetical protein